MDFTFCVNRPLPHGATFAGVSAEMIEATPVLRRPSLEAAVQFGGPLVRRLLEQVSLAGDRKYVTVDIKVTLLMPGWHPAIPGWHTDGVPRAGRSGAFEPDASGDPRLDVQASSPDMAPRYHLISVGLDSPTQFIDEPFELSLSDYKSPGLYAEMTRKVNALVDSRSLRTASIHNRWVSWDWWNVHRAVPATATGWRLLVRVTESDVLAPRKSDFIRAQTQVYAPADFGW